MHTTCTKTTTENPLQLLWCKCVWAQEDCAEPDSAAPGKHGNREVREHQNMNDSAHLKIRSVKLMQLLHGPEQFLKVITATSSRSSLPHQQPSAGHGIYRAMGQGTSPSQGLQILLGESGEGKSLRINTVRNNWSRQDPVWCLGRGTKPTVNYEESRDCSLPFTARAADSVALATALGSNAEP